MNGIKTAFFVTIRARLSLPARSLSPTGFSGIFGERGESMKRPGLIFGIMVAVLLSSLSVAQAQTQTTQTGAGSDSKRLTRVLVSGDSIVNAQPDTAILMISVVTQAKKAIDAQQENAVKSDAVMRAVKAAVASAEV